MPRTQKSQIDWSTLAANQRLMAATYAACPQAHNYKLIAKFFGQDASYDTIEGRYRKIKAEATRLRADAENGSGAGSESPSEDVKPVPAPTRGRAGGAAAVNGERKRGGEKQGVLNGRITKGKRDAGAGKGGAGRKVKAEANGDAFEASQSQSSNGVLRSTQSQGSNGVRSSVGRMSSQASDGGWHADLNGGGEHASFEEFMGGDYGYEVA
ncbi:MAG: hypothetical protein M1833_003341 [Piccolia ochrophora]|nr:MAG: hypothetical protein M1833_003341 [Piccolia ochrophora]